MARLTAAWPRLGRPQVEVAEGTLRRLTACVSARSHGRIRAVTGSWSSRPTACCSVPVPARHTLCSLALSPTHQPIFATVSNTAASSSARRLWRARGMIRRSPAEPSHDASVVAPHPPVQHRQGRLAWTVVLTQLLAGRHCDQRLTKDLLMPPEHGFRAAPARRRTRRQQTCTGQSGQ